MRTLDADTLAALEAGRYAVRELILFDLPSGRWGAFNDHFDLTWGGDTYRGAAGSFKLQVPPGAADLQPRAVHQSERGRDDDFGDDDQPAADQYLDRQRCARALRRAARDERRKVCPGQTC